MTNSQLVTSDSIERAARGLAAVATHTPLVPAWWLRAELGAEVRLKCENLQRTGSFKIRGAYTFVSRLTNDQRDGGLIAASSGNHAQAVALAAQLFGTSAVLVMPTTALPVKVEGVKRCGAEVVFAGTTHDEREARAAELERERGLVRVPSFDHPDIIAGQGTVGREILEDWPEVEVILVPTGGGGEVSGIGAWVKRTNPSCRVVGVQPDASAAIRRSLDAGELVTVRSTATIADGLRVERISDLTFAHIRAFVDDVVTVDEEAIRDTTRRLALEAKLIVEYSGATALAALLSGRFLPHGNRTAVVLSGGNIQPMEIARLIGSESR
ncbi:MAG: pyridoxal-phosphate dependent enzyme [Acidobacteria bacterium]|nr:pyridoxal-phosphate dependent enzyme [Acidobacteriota bacterium]